MKKIWSVVTVLAVANLLAMAGFVGWLVKGDRLNMDRVRQVRTMLVKTLAEEQAAVEAAAKADEVAKANAEREKAASKPPLTAEERLTARIEATELDQQRLERLKREVLDLKGQLALERERLVQDRIAFQLEKKQYDEAVAATNIAAGDAQFQKTLAVLQSQKPAVTVTLLKQMLIDATPVTETGGGPIANGATPPAPVGETPAVSPNMGMVVKYLDAMDEKKRSKLMAELTKTDPKLAADLLERLRKQGEFARVP